MPPFASPKDHPFGLTTRRNALRPGYELHAILVQADQPWPARQAAHYIRQLQIKLQLLKEHREGLFHEADKLAEIEICAEIQGSIKAAEDARKGLRAILERIQEIETGLRLHEEFILHQSDLAHHEQEPRNRGAKNSTR